MSTLRNLSAFLGVLVIAVVLQLIFVSVERRETPEKAAVDFAKAYFQLNPDMEDRVCQALLEEADPVEQLLQGARVEARQRGFETSFLKSQLFHVRTSVVEKGDESARVRLLGERKTAIHPAFAYFAKMWGIGETYHEDTVFDLVLEDGKWKVCDERLFAAF
jgi:hypothetical protein